MNGNEVFVLVESVTARASYPCHHLQGAPPHRRLRPLTFAFIRTHGWEWVYIRHMRMRRAAAAGGRG